MLKVGDKVRIKDKFVNDLGRKGEVMTIKRLYHLSNGTNETLMCDVGNWISYRADVLELVTEFDKAKSKHEELMAERKLSTSEQLSKSFKRVMSEVEKSIINMDLVSSIQNLLYDIRHCTDNEYENYETKLFELIDKYVELKDEREKAPKKETNFEHYIGEIVTSLTKEILLCDCLPSLEVNKCDSNCCNCIFGNENLLKNWLFSPYKEQKVMLTQFEYDLLNTIENETTNVNYTNKLLIFNGMADKGYFKGINDTSMTIKDILENSVIVDEK